MTKLAATLPKGTANGLGAIARRLIDQPHEQQLVIAVVDCKQTTTDNDTGDVIPTARIVGIEAVNHADQAHVARILEHTYTRRTGRDTLPLDLGIDLSRFTFEKTGDREITIHDSEDPLEGRDD